MRKLGIALIVVGVVVALFVIRFRSLGSGEPVRSIADVQAEEGVPVDVAQVTRGRLEVWRNFSGTVEGIRQGSIAAEIPQKVTAILKEVGDQVRAGEIILRLDPDNPRPGFIRFKQARADYEWARQNLERMKSLHAEGAISDQALDDVRTRFEVARADYEAARTTVELDAPIAGVVTYIGVTVGEQVAPGQRLATVAQVDRVRIVLDVSESEVRLLRRGQPVRVPSSVTGGPGLTGEVEQVALSADPQTRLFQVKLLVENSGRYLLPGSLVPAEVLINSREAVFRVPARAVLTNRVPAVFVVTGEGRAERQAIRTGISDGELIEVVSGLSVGEQVVVAGQSRLSGGEKVKIHQQVSY